MSKKTNMNDKTTTFQELKDLVAEFRKKRGWMGNDPKDAAIGLVLEASEVLEHFQWQSGEEVLDEERLREPLGDELADVLWYLCMLSNRTGIDLAKAFECKFEKQKKKWPEELFKPGMTKTEKQKAYFGVKARYRGGHPLAENVGDDD